jgi:post-segregation antitoxin (ccd killing protein)
MTDIKLKDIKLALSQATLTNIQKAIEKRTKILGRVKTYESAASSSQFARNSVFNAPIYDLSEVARAADVEPYIMNSIRKHRTNILKEGYEIKGDDQRTVDYINNRLYEIAMVTGIPTQTWVRDFITNVIMYHNGYLVFRRDADRSSGKQIKMYGKTLDPIAGIFVMDPVTVEVEVDKYGTPQTWRQALYGRYSEGKVEKLFGPEDVLHVAVDRKTGFTFGTPYLISVLDDIRALRKLEELALVLAEREAFPLYHYKVGSENRPALIYEDGSNEVDTVLSQLSSMPSQGYIITSERHEVSLISRDKSSMDLQPLLEYFESRVLGGLSLSPLDLGRAETSNKGTASSVSQNLQDSARDYQVTVSAHLTHQLLIPLLLEGGFDVNLDNMVYFGFPLISKDEERAQQNQGLQLMMGNAITVDEFRREYLNKKPLGNEDQPGLLMNKELEGQVKLARVAAKAKAASSPTIKATSKLVANKAKPANQYGSKIKSRFKKNDTLSVDVYVEAFKKAVLSISHSDLTSVEDAVSVTMVTLVRDCTISTSDEILDMIDSGFAVAKEQYQDMHPSFSDEVEPIGERSLNRFKANFISGSYWKVLNPHKNTIVNALTPDADGNTNSFTLIKNMEIIKSSIANLIKDQIDTAFRFGFIRFAKRMGYKIIELVDETSKELVEQIGIEDVIYKEFIPTSINVDCELRLPSGDSK